MLYLMFILDETYTDGYKTIVLDILSLSAVLCGILVIIIKNPVVSVLYLIGLFFSISCYLMVLGINYIGLSYLLVYVGAVSILFLFILMLINVRISELLSDTSNSIPLAFITGTAFSFTVYDILPYNVMTFAGYGYNNLKNIITTLLNFGSFSKHTEYSENNELIFVTSSS